MFGLIDYFNKSIEVKSILNGIQEGLNEQLIAGLSGSARTLMIASIYNESKQSQLIITHNLFQAQKLYDDLIELVNEDEVFIYPVNELIASEIAVASPELKSQRIEVLNYWSQGKKGIVIAPVAGLRRMIPPKDQWKGSQVEFKVGEEIELENTLHLLVKMGYERSSMVDSPGQFSVRGGIIDIYPLTEENPIRIELFDTEIDSIRSFTIEDQRSNQSITSIKIGPASEIILDQDGYGKTINRLQEALSNSLKKVKNKTIKEKMADEVGFDVEKLKEGHYFQEIYKYISLLYDTPASLIDYLPSNGMIVFDEISRIQEMSERLEKEEADWYTTLLEEGKIVTDLSISYDFQELQQSIQKPIIYLSLFLRHVPYTQPENILNMTCKAMQNFHGQMDLLQGELKRWKHGDFSVVFLTSDLERAKRLEHVLADYDIDALITNEKADISTTQLQILPLNISGGFELSMQKLVVITEEELFKKKPKQSKRRQKLSNAERIKSYSELKVGDYVVHVNHGIGKFLGIETLELKGIHKDFLHIKYSGNDKLYVPVEQIDQVQKYVGSEGKEPKVYKLGGTEWKKVKSKVQSSVEDIADDLIKLYAEREASVGYAFSPDGEEQKEFEASFAYQETEDQLRTITEIKQDMEKERPMDRLLCGDVGYGKTEVALRAAIKAVMDGKQVAILVPTTILAQQHFETCRERFQGTAVEIGLLSRFRTRKQQQEVMKGLKNGTVDVVIGTHRILSKDMKFNELGLLIIDEEQRFGVTHKEKIKKMKANVDVLTLTATPIPRTLHMSMLGVRDLSVIETPPENRFPIQTYVVEHNGALVREAVEREMARGGQIYYLYNRVEDIERKAEEISMLIPDAKVTFAHGKMNENELEAVMLDFLEGQYDVLVSTTIIETGVDIPNVNTLIVHDADKMGLSQLYQLRGRVGRSNRVAYAYFTYHKDKVLTEVAEKRLQAIKEFTELGSGFKIAMRDLSIRGAGNLLGAQQHGFIDSVGFDLYSQMLKEAIEERKGTDEQKKVVKVEVNMELDAYIPGDYISDSKQKIEMYKRFRSIDSFEDVAELQEDMIDRFGEFPEEVNLLFILSRIKQMAKELKVESISQKKDNVDIIFTLEGSKEVNKDRLSKMALEIGRNIGIGADENKLKLAVKSKGQTDKEKLERIEHILSLLGTFQLEAVH